MHFFHKDPIVLFKTCHMIKIVSEILNSFKHEKMYIYSIFVSICMVEVLLQTFSPIIWKEYG